MVFVWLNCAYVIWYDIVCVGMCICVCGCCCVDYFVVVVLMSVLWLYCVDDCGVVLLGIVVLLC